MIQRDLAYCIVTSPASATGNTWIKFHDIWLKIEGSFNVTLKYNENGHSKQLTDIICVYVFITTTLHILRFCLFDLML